MTMDVLRDYENTSSQLVDRDKRALYMHRNTSPVLSQEVTNCLGFNREFLFLSNILIVLFFILRKKDVL